MKITFYALTCALCALLVLPAAAQVPSYVPTDGLVGWWPFNGNANDESGNGNDATNFGGVLTSDRNDNPQSAYSFVSGYVSAASSEFNTTSFSFSAWAKPNSITGNGFGDIGGTYFNYQGYFLGIQGGVPKARIHSPSSNSSQDVVSSQTVLPNVWYQITVTYEAPILKIFVDGNCSGTTNTGSFQFQNRSSLAIGRSPWVLNELQSSFPGSLDDIAIYNRALTEQEIQNLYTGTTPPPCVSLPSNLQQGLVGYWPFCGNANDESGNGNDGVVNGATLTEDRFGNANAAYGFDGVDDFINCGGVNEFNLESVSVSIWANENSFPDTRDHTFFSKGAFGNGEIGYRATVNQNQRSYFIWSVDPFGSDYVESADSNDLGDWHHYIFSKDQDTMRIFIDGILDSELIHPRSPLNNSSPFLIGGNRDVAFPLPSYVDFWYGSLDDIAIWNRALTPEEVQELYTLDACTFTVYDTVTVYETVYDTVYTYETIYDTVTTYITVTDTLLIDIILTGFEGQPSELNTITVFPNPASDHITIDYGNYALMAGYNTIITDAAGATVYSSAVNSQQVEIDINAWGAMGVYYMMIYDGNGELVAVRQIVLE